MNTTDVQGAFREMWQTRPARPRDDRQVAGVASAIARRYDIDPTLVRIAFVVAAFSGVGAALYIAGWIALPGEGGNDAASGSRSPKPILLVGLVIAALASAGSFFSGHNGEWFVALLVVTALLFLLHRSRGDRIGAAPPAGAEATPTVSLHKDDGAPAAPVPPAWDPLGAAPFAWDLPEPSPVQAPPVRVRRAPVTAVTLGLALLAGAGTAVILLLIGRFGITSAPLLLGVGLGVVGLGLLVGSFLHAGRGLIPVALILAAMTWGALSAPLDRFSDDGLGDLRIIPVDVAALQPVYRHGAGDVTFDLRGLDLSGTGDVTTEVDNSLGDVDVLLPPNADVRFTGDAGLGDVTFDGQEVSGSPGAKVVRTDLGADGQAAGRTLVLDVRTGAGDVDVHRG